MVPMVFEGTHVSCTHELSLNHQDVTPVTSSDLKCKLVSLHFKSELMTGAH